MNNYNLTFATIMQGVAINNIVSVVIENLNLKVSFLLTKALWITLEIAELSYCTPSGQVLIISTLQNNFKVV